MTLWSPEYRIKADGTNVTGITLVGFTINRGRNDINSPVNASVCNLSLINFENTLYPFTINTGLTVEVKNSAGNYVYLFGGRISDIATQVTAAGATAVITELSIVAVGSMAKMGRATVDGNLAEDTDGNQIKTLIYEISADQWNEVNATLTWTNYDPIATWESLEGNVGDIDTGFYTMRSQTLTNATISDVANSIAQSAGGYIYEDARGRLCYADINHRADELNANGYVDLDARQALANGISAVKRQGDVVNKFTIAHGVNFSNSHTEENTESQADYGLFAQAQNSYLKNSADVTTFAQRVLNLRAYPIDRFQSITFPVHSTDIDDTDRDALLNISMATPVRLANLPANITQGQFAGFVEGWSWRSTVNGLFLTINASPTAFSAVSQRWEQVNVAEQWNTLSNTLKWEYAIGVIS